MPARIRGTFERSADGAWVLTIEEPHGTHCTVVASDGEGLDAVVEKYLAELETRSESDH